MNEGIEEDDLHSFSDIDGDEIPQNNVPETQENEEIYRFNLNADTHPSNEYTQDLTRLPSLRCEEHTRQAQELMFEVLQLVIEEDNHVRLQYKTQLMDIKEF
ncbi:hypothetical protein Bca52824_003013 [Brassica carinata]|uniref:Uncharacterized protein n=1 Tax=Brassica carinata TaxID=52824 RepID=A0A8X7WIY4_BRACI|nr:hypothetical protein Bca52824_003013 [Brassica carinata]